MNKQKVTPYKSTEHKIRLHKPNIRKTVRLQELSSIMVLSKKFLAISSTSDTIWIPLIGP
jgi:hypothetical protein